MDKTEAEKICICPDCPTYVPCEESVSFCLYPLGQSQCISAEHGCVCGGCPVHDADNMLFGYYCTHGSEAAQAGD